MDQPNRISDGAVAIHSWSANGEGWAYHRDFAHHLPELLDAAKTELNERQSLAVDRGTRDVLLEWPQGFLVGVHQQDPQCADPGAKDRSPTILKLAHLSAQPDVETAQRIRGILTGLAAENHGPDGKLSIPVAAAPQNRPNRSALWAGLMALTFAGLAAAFFLFGRAWLDPSAKVYVKVSGIMLQLLRDWRFGEVESIARDPEKVVQAFFRTLSQERLGERLIGDHPDVKFLQRLPEPSLAPRDADQLIRQLRKLRSCLSGKAMNNIDPARPDKSDAILKDIARLMDYREWWQGWDGRTMFWGQHTSPETVREAALRFVSLDPADRARLEWQRPAAAEMVKLLNRWGLNGVSERDSSERPWLVFYCFFKFLSQERLPPGDLADRSYYSAFVGRLPESSPELDVIASSEDAMRQALRGLVHRMSAARSSDLPTTLVSYIGQEMDYNQWAKKARDVLGQRPEESTGREVNDMVKRFIRKP